MVLIIQIQHYSRFSECAEARRNRKLLNVLCTKKGPVGSKNSKVVYLYSQKGQKGYEVKDR
jgi:hypothetical protein